MSEHQKEIAFLRRCLFYDDTTEGHQLEQEIAQNQRNERCVRRAVGLMAFLTTLALAGLGYATVFLKDIPHNGSQFLTPLHMKAFCALGVGSLICLLAFGGLGAIYRKKLEHLLDRCRWLVTKLLESRPDTSHPNPVGGTCSLRTTAPAPSSTSTDN